MAARTPGLGVEGYWLDENRYFFVDEVLDSVLDRIVYLPSIADCRSRTTREVVPFDELVDLLATAQPKLCRALVADASFDLPNDRTLAVSVDGRDHLVDVHARRVVGTSEALEYNAVYSPDGVHACFAREHDLWLKERGGGRERQLTTHGIERWAYGRRPESCLAAVSDRRKPLPIATWSADSQWLLTHRIDERLVPRLPLIEHLPAHAGRPLVHQYAYPFPGDPIPVGTIVAIHVESGRVVEFDDCKFPVVSPWARRMDAWFGERGEAWLLRFDRYSKGLELIRLDLAKGSSAIVLHEECSSGYLDLHQVMGATPNVRTLRSGDVIWFSERDGWGHLYLYDGSTGRLKNRITKGSWMVRDIVDVDLDRESVLFTACGVNPETDPSRRTFCRASLDGSGFEILCGHDGDVCVPKTEALVPPQNRPCLPGELRPGVSPNGRFAPVLYSNVAEGNETRVVDLETGEGFTIAATQPLRGVPPREFSAFAADGVTKVHGVLFLPGDFDESSRYPLVDYIYPGPHVTHRPQGFGVEAAFGQAIAELGMVAMMLDTRGMPFRSRALHQAGYGGFAEPQLSDHSAVVRQLCEAHAFLDADRVGIIGYSGGGFSAARAMLDYPSTFKVGVSVCGNHDCNAYAAGWSDKYFGPEPTKDEGTADGARATNLQGPLLLISGDMDENVHVSHTLKVAAALIGANKDFDLLVVPRVGHMLLMTDGYALRRAWDFLVRHLLDATPPSGFRLAYEPHELRRFEANFFRGLW